MPQVIIPKPIYPSPLNQQQLFQSSFQNKDINSSAPKDSLTYSKNLNGAFKLFKQKKYRNRDRQNAEDYQRAQTSQPLDNKVYKLIKKKILNQSLDNFTSFNKETEPFFGYFDPNNAPTFVEQENKQFYLKMYKQKLNQSIERKSIQNQQRILVQKKVLKEIELQQSQNQFIMIAQEGKTTDPFIILKKTKIKKIKHMRNIQNLPTETKKTATKKDDCKPRKIETLQKSKMIQKSLKKQKQKNKQELIGNQMSNSCSLKKQQRTQCKQKSPNEKETNRKRIREYQDNFSQPRFILHLSLESQSNILLSDYESLDEKQVIPLIK